MKTRRTGPFHGGLSSDDRESMCIISPPTSPLSCSWAYNMYDMVHVHTYACSHAHLLDMRYTSVSFFYHSRSALPA